MGIDLGDMYRAARLRVGELAGNSAADHAVPATPAWDVHDVVAHLAGVMSDVVSGNMQGAATAPWTAAQVERGRGKSVAEVIDEWAAGAPGFESFLSSPAGSKVGSAVVDSRSPTSNCSAAVSDAAPATRSPRSVGQPTPLRISTPSSCSVPPITP